MTDNDKCTQVQKCIENECTHTHKVSVKVYMYIRRPCCVCIEVYVYRTVYVLKVVVVYVIFGGKCKSTNVIKFAYHSLDFELLLVVVLPMVQTTYVCVF